MSAREEVIRKVVEKHQAILEAVFHIDAKVEISGAEALKTARAACVIRALRTMSYQQVREEAKRQWGFKSNTTWADIWHRVDSLFQEAAREEAQSVKPVIISRLEDLYRESRTRGDRKTALAVLKELGDTLGTHSATKVDVNDKSVIELVSMIDRDNTV